MFIGVSAHMSYYRTYFISLEKDKQGTTITLGNNHKRETADFSHFNDDLENADSN